MKLTSRHIPLLAATMVAGLLVGAGLQNCRGTQQKPSEPEVVHDTIAIREEVIREKTVVRSVTEYDTAIVFLHDTIRDTIVIQIPIEQKEYRDTVSADSMRVRLHILFHGYHAGIDHVGLSYDARPIIRTEVRKKGWGQFVGIGIGAGYGACVQSGIVYAGPQVGLNVVYGFGYHF